jgi:Na+/H+ antiporter NhaC
MPLTMLSIIASILFAVVLFYTVSRHYKLWRTAQQQPNAGEATPIKHRNEFWLRALLLLPSLALFILAKDFNLHTFMNSVSMVAYLFWFLFDGLFNLKRGKDWWFIGTIDKDESYFDNFKRKLGPVWTKIVQITLAVGCVIIYIFS